MKKQNSNQNVNVEKMVVFVKTFGYYYHKFNFGNFFQLSCKPVKELETEILAIYKVLFEKLYTILTMITMDLFFEAAHGLGEQKRSPP